MIAGISQETLHNSRTPSLVELSVPAIHGKSDALVTTVYDGYGKLGLRW